MATIKRMPLQAGTLFYSLWSFESNLYAKWKYDGIDENLDESERYWKMAARRWTCAACGKEGLAHQPSMNDGSDGREYPRVQFLETGTALCIDCIEPLKRIREELERKILRRHPEWDPSPPWCGVCGLTCRPRDSQFVKDMGLVHVECIKP